MKFLALLKKEFLQFFRNRGLLILVIYFFTFDVYIAGIGIDLSLKNARFYALDRDITPASREIVERLVAPWFRFEGYLVPEQKP